MDPDANRIRPAHRHAAVTDATHRRDFEKAIRLNPLGARGEVAISANVVLFAWHDEQRWVLLVPHPEADANGWALPGGPVAEGRDPADDALRHFADRTALELESLKPGGVYCDPRGRHITAVFWDELDYLAQPEDDDRTLPVIRTDAPVPPADQIAYALGAKGNDGPAAGVWFCVDHGALPWTDLAHDHAEIIRGTLHLARGYA